MLMTESCPIITLQIKISENWHIFSVLRSMCAVGSKRLNVERKGKIMCYDIK